MSTSPFHRPRRDTAPTWGWGILSAIAGLLILCAGLCGGGR